MDAILQTAYNKYWFCSSFFITTISIGFYIHTLSWCVLEFLTRPTVQLTWGTT